MKVEELKKRKCGKRFRFGPGKVYTSEVVYELPLVVKSEDGKEVFLEIDVYEVDAMVPMLCGKDAMEKWKAVIDVEEKTMMLSLGWKQTMNR